MKTSPQTLSQQDQHFITEAVHGGTAEVKLSQLVTDHGRDQKVRQFSEHMIHDHTEANQELMQLVSGKGISISEELDQEHKMLVDRLSNLTGEEFDREYINAMVQDHTKVIAEFEREVRQGQDEDLKTWAGRILPKLQQHLQMARDITIRH